jgi:hypothetical protein
VGVLPGANDDLADPAHGWLSLDIMLVAESYNTSSCGNRSLRWLSAKAGLLNAGVEVVADHQHVDMLVKCVDGVA